MASSASETLPVVVVGAGLIGAAVAEALHRRGRDVVLMDPALDRAVDAPPRALLHPATGPRAAVSRTRVASFRYARALITRVAPAHAWHPTGCLRIVSREKFAPIWKETADKFPEVLQWRTPSMLAELLDTLDPSILGGLWIPDAVTVSMPALIRALRHASGAAQCVDKVVRVSADGDGWRVSGSHSEIDASAVVMAAPSDSLLRAHGVTTLSRVPGSVIVARGPAPSFAYGERGQTLPTGVDGVGVLSATYRPDGTPAGVTNDDITRLIARAETALPGSTWTPIGGWSGYRNVGKARLPLVGPVDDGVWVCTGFGGKGLLVGLAMADRVAAAVCGAALQVPDGLAPQRD